MLRVVQYEHLLLVLLLQLIVVLLTVQGYLVPDRCADKAASFAVMQLVVELRLQERLLVLITKVRVRHIERRGLGGVVARRIHLPCDLGTLEVYQGLLERSQDVLAAHILL